MEISLFLLQIIKVVTVAIGVWIVRLLLRGHRREKSQSMLFLAIGFILITVGAIIEGILFEFFDYSLLEVNIVGSMVTLGGLIFVVYSIYGTSN